MLFVAALAVARFKGKLRRYNQACWLQGIATTLHAGLSLLAGEPVRCESLYPSDRIVEITLGRCGGAWSFPMQLAVFCADALGLSGRSFCAFVAAEAGLLCVARHPADLRSEVYSELNFSPNFEGLVLGCIDADFCK